MFSLIITVTHAMLVCALALATVYYGGMADDERTLNQLFAGKSKGPAAKGRGNWYLTR